MVAGQRSVIDLCGRNGSGLFVKPVGTLVARFWFKTAQTQADCDSFYVIAVSYFSSIFKHYFHFVKNDTMNLF